MKEMEQGVLNNGRLPQLLVHLLLLFLFLLPQKSFADTDLSIPPIIADEPRGFHLALMYTAESELQSDIIKKLSRSLILKQTNIRITKISEPNNSPSTDDEPDLIVAIGLNNIQSANEYYTKTSKLVITSDPGNFSENRDDGNHDAVLYMTQPYCRQIHFISLINKQWHTFSYFNNRNKPVDDLPLKQCANKYEIDAYQVNVTDTEQLTNLIKNALNHSDLILALPDKDIFNSKTVKNILLTSYRYRKPVIAFSANFVNAGALASIHSNTDQIAESASDLIAGYIAHNHKFTNAFNYPRMFDIDINTQVFRALNLNIPDIEKIKQDIVNSDLASTR